MKCKETEDKRKCITSKRVKTNRTSIYNNWHFLRSVLTCGCSALKGGMPTINSNKMMPTDHQSAVVPDENEYITYIVNKIIKENKL